MITSSLRVGLGNAVRHGPRYRRLAENLRSAIDSGLLGAGSKLPSERDLARSLSVSRTTVIAAYRLLREDGLLDSVQGSGTRVAAKGPRIGPPVRAGAVPATKLPGDLPSDAIDLTASWIPDLDPLPDEVLQLTGAEVRQLAGTFGYEPCGLPVLRAIIAARYTRRGEPTDTNEILVTTGGQQALRLLFELFGQDQGSIVAENPTYAGALDAARAAGLAVVGVPTDEQGINCRALHTALGRPEVRLLYLMPDCHNPTGTAPSQARRHEVARLAEAAGTSVVDDATLADLVFDRPPGALFGAGSRSLVIRVGSLSKLFWPGLRVGWIRAPSHLIARLARLKVVADLGSSLPSQALAARLLAESEEVAAVRRRQLTRRCDQLTELLQQHLPAWSWTQPQGGPFLWVRLPSGDADAYARLALHHGVRVLPGTRTSPDGSFTDHLRISFTAGEDVMTEAAQRLVRAWDGYASPGGSDWTEFGLVV